jgi:PEP-CTERM motif
MDPLGTSATRLFLITVFAALLVVPPAFADTVSSESFTGTLASSDSVFVTTITISAGTDILLQTYGFGGGTNAQGTAIAPGGTDPFLAIFSGVGGSAAILTDGMGDPYGTSVDLTNYASFTGCPPAGALDFGGPICADVTMSLSALDAGTYTVVFSDGQYIANAVFDNGTLGEGFSDLTGGVFCNIANNGVNCPNPLGGAYALDITTTSPSSVPEPGTLALLGSGLFALGIFHLRRPI